MSIRIAKPSHFLRPYIKQYWCIENMLSEGEKHIQRIIPSGLPELTLYFGIKPKIVGNKEDYEDNFILSGHQKEFYDLHIEKELSVFSIVFHPQGLMAFLNLPLTELYNQNIPLKYLDKELEQEISHRLAHEHSFEKRIQIVESFFCGLLKEEYNRFDFSRINHAIQTISQTGGQVSVDYLASETCLSRKQFERKFSELIGITPKKYLKTIRLQYSLYLKSRDETLSMTDLALESGYYDQPHFNNEFKTLTGFTPRQYFDKSAAFSDFFEW